MNAPPPPAIPQPNQAPANLAQTPRLLSRRPSLQNPVQSLLQVIRLNRIRAVRSIVLPAVVEHKLSVVQKVFHVAVVIVLQLVLHCGQVYA
jgi:hypothetical protein